MVTLSSSRCLKNLANYHTPHIRIPLPRARQAAVLVALFVGRQGDLYVLLNRRASTLRTYAGDTSLPGGKVEPGDKTIEDTAVRIHALSPPLTRFLKNLDICRDGKHLRR